MTDVQAQTYTASDLLHISNEGQRAELIRGELVEMAPTGGIHNIITAELIRRIGNAVWTGKLGHCFSAENGFVLNTDPYTVLAPDVAFVAAGRLKHIPEKYVEIAPDLVVEVVSPGNSAAEMEEKTALYFQAGVRQVWIVYPRTHAIHVYKTPTESVILRPPQIIDGGDILSGFSMPLADLFGLIAD